MRTRTFLLILAIALAAALAACGGDAIPGEIRATTAEPSTHPKLVPAFDARGFVLREPSTDEVIMDAAKGAERPAGLRPAFRADGTLMRGPETGSPLYVLERGGETVFVRDGGR